MVPKCSMFAFVVVICTLLKEGHALNCFNCSSVLDDKCGKTWGYSGAEGDKHKITCEAAEGDIAACRKLETTDSFKGMQLVVRSCWKTNETSIAEEFFDCTKMASIGKACYCNKDLCNGQQPLSVYSALIVPATLAIFSFLF